MERHLLDQSRQRAQSSGRKLEMELSHSPGRAALNGEREPRSLDFWDLLDMAVIVSVFLLLSLSVETGAEGNAEDRGCWAESK